MIERNETRPGGNGTGSSDQVDAGSSPIVPPATDALTEGAPTIIREATAWLRGRAGDRVHEIRAHGLDPDGATTIVVPLGSTGDIGSREDRTCDRCRTYVPIGAPFYPIAHRPAKSVFVVGGLCETCARAEVVVR